MMPAYCWCIFAEKDARMYRLVRLGKACQRPKGNQRLKDARFFDESQKR